MAEKTKRRKERSVGESKKTAGHGRDIIVIGASAGGVEALINLVRQFPPDLPAAVFIVLHIAPYPPSSLPDILTRAGRLPVSHAVHGEPVQPGRIYVAPSDNHMMLQGGTLRVVRGPKENGHRPAVDPLFRTAAREYRSRVIGVVLTGALDCGTAGLMAIKSLGGLAVVQDPKEALCGDMPRSAIDHVTVDHIVPISEMAPLLERLSREPAKGNGKDEMSKRNHLERQGDKISLMTCPECSGSLKESEQGGLLRFRCHVGHAFTAEGMIAEQAEALEAALWTAVRTLEESEMLARRMTSRSDPSMASRFAEKAEAMKQHAAVIRNVLLNGREITLPDAAIPTRREAGSRME